MVKYLIIIFSLLFAACSKNSSNNYKNNDEFMKISRINDTVLEIRIDKYKLHWDNVNGQIIQNSTFDSIKSYFPIFKLKIAEEIANAEPTEAIICDSIKLKKGDLAFILVDNITPLPYVALFELQMDVMIINCMYPDGFFDELDYQRPEITEKVEEYLN